MALRITTSQAESVATEVQRVMASLKIPIQHFRVSMVGGNSIVEFEADVSHIQQEQIASQLNRQGVVTEVIRVEGHHERAVIPGRRANPRRLRQVHAWECLPRRLLRGLAECSRG